MERTVALGDYVSHDGCWGAAEGDENGPFIVTGFTRRAALTQDGEPTVVNFVIFENRRYRVECQESDLVWLDEDNAWMLPGRLLSRKQRELWSAAIGVKQPPPAGKHVEARRFLGLMGAI